MSLIRENNLLNEDGDVINPAISIGSGEDVILDTDIIDNGSLTGGTIAMGVDDKDKARPFTMTGGKDNKARVSSNGDMYLKDILIQLQILNKHMEFITENTLTNHFKN